MNDDISKAGLPVSHDEKSNIETMEQGNTPAAFPGAGAASWSPEHRARVEKSMKRKLDLRCSLFVVIYIMNYLDRNNIAAAKLKGLTEDLGIEGDEAKYQTCLSILYVGYILMQVPSNMLINTISRPSLYIAAVMLIWGMVSTLSGVTHNFAGMVATRFFLGFVEAAFLPGALMVSLSTTFLNRLAILTTIPTDPLKVVHPSGAYQKKRHPLLRQPHLQRLLCLGRRRSSEQHGGGSWTLCLEVVVLD